MNDRIVVKASIQALLAYINPVETPPWEGSEDLTLEQVLIELQGLAREPLPQEPGVSASSTWHARRIAFLIDSGWSDPIQIDFPRSLGGGPWPVTDGNHRLYAAIAAGRSEIDIEVFGFLDTAEEILGLRID